MKTKLNRHNRRERELNRRITHSMYDDSCLYYVEMYANDERENEWYFIDCFPSIGAAYDYCKREHIPTDIVRFHGYTEPWCWYFNPPEEYESEKLSRREYAMMNLLKAVAREF